MTQLFSVKCLSKITCIIKPAQTTGSQRVLSQVCAHCVLLQKISMASPVFPTFSPSQYYRFPISSDPSLATVPKRGTGIDPEGSTHPAISTSWCETQSSHVGSGSEVVQASPATVQMHPIHIFLTGKHPKTQAKTYDSVVIKLIAPCTKTQRVLLGFSRSRGTAMEVSAHTESQNGSSWKGP